MTQAHRLIKHPDKPLPGIEVYDMCERDSAYHLAHDFDMPEYAETQPSELELLEIKPSRMSRTKRSWK